VTTTRPPDVTALLRAWSQGDRSALDRLTPLIYDELRYLAHRYMRRERGGHTLQTTGLVSEAFMRLVDVKGIDWQDRAHFLAVSARIMRRIRRTLHRRGLRRDAGDAAGPRDRALCSR
jgi:RNA polymerase sigma-70 factor (ECF subfamily)